MKNNLPFKLRNEILTRDNFSCQKCNFKDETSEGLELHHIKPKVSGGLNESQNIITLCSICHNYAPDSEKDFILYINEKIDGNILNTFRHSLYSISKKTKQGMTKQFFKGKHLTKAPKGYKIVDKELVPDENADTIPKIFQEFLDTDISLTQLAKKNNMTTVGIKKLLQNATYLGKVKFASQESNGKHKPLISVILFNNIQNKLKQKGWIK